MFKTARKPKTASRSMEYEVAPSYFEKPRSKRTYMSRTERETLLKSYLSEVEGQTVSLTQIAKSMGLSNSMACRILNDLIANKEVERIGTRNTCSYKVLKGATPATGTPVSSSMPIEALVWKFVRETRTTDILLFLAWLEQRG